VLQEQTDTVTSVTGTNRQGNQCYSSYALHFCSMICIYLQSFFVDFSCSFRVMSRTRKCWWTYRQTKQQQGALSSGRNSLIQCQYLICVFGLLMVWCEPQDLLEMLKGFVDVVLIVQTHAPHIQGIRVDAFSLQYIAGNTIFTVV